MKKFLLPLAVSLVSSAIIAGVTYAVKKQGGIEPTIDKFKQSKFVTATTRKIGDLKTRFAANDSTDLAAAA